MMNSMKLCFALFALSAAFTIPANEGNKKTMNKDMHKNTKIGIIGGGPAGLYAARKLAQAGYKKIWVLEASDAVCPTIRTENWNGEIHDLTTRYISAVSTHGAGIQSNLQELIDEFGLEHQEVNTPLDYVHLMPAGLPPQLLAAPHIFADFFAPGGSGALGIIVQLIHGFDILKAVDEAKTIPACRTAIGATAGQTWEDWAPTQNLPAFTRLAAFTNDIFLGGPSTHQDVCHFLNIRTHFMTTDIVHVLRSFGLNHETQLPIPMAPELREVLNPAVPYLRRQFTNGYKQICEKMAESTDFTVLTNARVTEIQIKNNGDLRVFSEAGRLDFDKVIIATRPEQTSQFLPSTHAAFGHMQQGDSTPVHVHAIKTSGTCPLYPNGEFISVLYPNSGMLASDTMPQGVIGINKQFSDSPLVVAIGYATDNENDDDELARVMGNIQAMGMTPESVEYGFVIDYPAFITPYAVAHDWYTEMENLQGDQGFYFMGEALSGYGIPAVLEYVSDHIEAHFGTASNKGVSEEVSQNSE